MRRQVSHGIRTDYMHTHVIRNPPYSGGIVDTHMHSYVRTYIHEDRPYG